MSGKFNVKSFVGKSRFVEIGFGNGNYYKAFEFTMIQSDSEKLISEILEILKKKNIKIIPKSFKSKSEILDLKEEHIFNCTGMGSYDLFEDKNLYPLKG